MGCLSNLPHLLLVLLSVGFSLSQKSVPQPSASSTPATDFTCPEDFGYFPHPTDCTQYFVCVFGGALLESCTGGLMYSHDLQTCDWPRNVYCYNGTTFVDNNNVQQPSPQESRSRTRGAVSPTQVSTRNPSYSYNPIKIETYGQLSRAQEESSVVGKKPGRVVIPDDEYQQQRSGRSYEGSLPNYKEEIYQQGRINVLDHHHDNNNTLTDDADCTTNTRSSTICNQHVIVKRSNNLHSYNHRSIFDLLPHSNARTARSRSHVHEQKNSISRMDVSNPHHLSKYKISGHAGLKHTPVGSPSNVISHRVSSPGSVLYPPSYYQTPTYGFVNIDKVRSRPASQVSITTPAPQSSRVVKITTGKPFTDNAHDGSFYSSQRFGGGNLVLGEYDRYRDRGNLVNGGFDPRWQQQHVQAIEHEKTLSEFVRDAYVNRLKGNLGFERGGGGSSVGSGSGHGGNVHGGNVHGGNVNGGNVHGGNVHGGNVHGGNVHGGNAHGGNVHGGNTHGASPQSNNFPKKIVISTGNLAGGLPFVVEQVRNNQQQVDNNRGSVSSSPLATTRSKYAGNTNKYYDNNAAVLQQQPAQEYGNEDVYVNQRYAANVGNNTGAYYYAPGGGQEEDDSSYYVYDDEEEEVVQQPQQGGQKYQSNDFVKYQQPQQQTYRTPAPVQQTVTRRPQTSVQPTSSRTASRGSSRTRGSSSSSSGSSSSSTRSRPTLKPKSSIVKQASAPVRDVYLDPPSRPENIYETPTMNTPATKCKKDLCVLPDCYCGGKDIPGGLRPEQTPQIVLLTFDDSVNDLNKNLYRDLFEKGRKNPNGCPISATFYISHEWTDYSQVQNLAADGHEIASHSVSHSFGEQYSQKKWDREINGQREILAAYGGVKLSEVRGMRAPFLAIGGNNMFKMLHDSNFTYDSSMPIYENRPPSWPYTLDYRIFHDCMIPPCPTKSYPGVWEVPMVMWQDLKGGRCSMGDACSNPPTAEGVYQMLAKNFERHYTTNRAPFGLYYHAAWFTQPHHKEGFEAFLDTLVQMDDVWLVTNYQALQWIRNPVPNSRILNYEPWSCHDQKDRPPRCNHPKVCNLWHKSGVRYMKTCQACPQQYPWTGNTGVPFSNSL